MILEYALTNGHRIRERLAMEDGEPVTLQEATETLTLLLSGVDPAGRLVSSGPPPAIGVRDLDGRRHILMTANIVEIQVLKEEGDPADPAE